MKNTNSLLSAIRGLNRSIRQANKSHFVSNSQSNDMLARLHQAVMSNAFHSVRRSDIASDLGSRTNELLSRFSQLIDAERTMMANRGKFQNLNQAAAYNERMREINNTGWAKRAREERLYGGGADDIRKAQAKRIFDMDMMDPYERRLKSLTERYGGDVDMAEAKMRQEVFKGFPDFFKNTHLSTKSLSRLEEYGKHIPLLGRGLSFLRTANSLGGGWGAAIMQGITLGIEGVKAVGRQERETIRTNLHARGGGMRAESYYAQDAVLRAYGSSAESSLSQTKNWNLKMGRLFTGNGGSEFLTELARYGVDITGSGAGGLATSEEMKNNGAKKIRELMIAAANGDTIAYSEALALKEALGFDDGQFEIAWKQGKNYSKYVGGSDYIKRLARVLSSYDEAALQGQLGSSAADMTTKALKKGALDAASLKGLPNISTDSSTVTSTYGSTSPEFIMAFSSKNKDIANAIANGAKTEEAARSYDDYEANGSRANTTTNESKGAKESPPVQIHIAKVESHANHPEEFVEEMVKESSRFINPMILQSIDGGYLA